MKKAFTLAEIMIVLAVIGVLTAILLPVAFHSTPDENIMKFKKGHNALLTAVRELVNSDKYYLEGDLGKRANGVLLDGTHDGDKTYFCKTLADIINTDEVNCSDADTGVSYVGMSWEVDGTLGTEKVPEYLDRACKKYANQVGDEIITNDKISIYQAGPTYTFGEMVDDGTGPYRLYFSLWDGEGVNPENFNTGFYNMYKITCLDVDETPEGVSEDDCVNECPFGYGVRVDGKVIFGARAQEWLQKSIQQ